MPTGLAAEYFAPLKDKQSGGPPTVGYMARICPEKGFDRLVDAMVLLRQRPGFEDVKLLAAGYLAARDQKWFDALKARIEAARWPMDFSSWGKWIGRTRFRCWIRSMC